MRAEPAIVEALDLFKQPAKARSMHRHQLPPDMLTVIKIAAGDQQTTEAWVESCGEKSEVLRQAASFFLQQTIAKSGHDGLRTLGLSIEATKDDIRLHKRWLLKWLHPDRNTSKWETNLFHRVSSVAQTLEMAEIDVIIAKRAVTPSALKPPKHGHQKRYRLDSRMRSPVRRFSWKTLFFRFLKRAFLAIVLMSIIWLLAFIFVGQKAVWPQTSGL
jgi:hypothetical protein